MHRFFSTPLYRVMVAALVLWTFAVTLSRSLIMPLAYAQAQWLLDYRFGFVKRALPAQLLTWIGDLLGIPAGQPLVLGACIAMMIVFCLVLLLIAWNILQAHNWSVNAFAIVLAFFSSPLIVTSGNVIGYYDNIIMVLGLLSLLLLTNGRFMLATLIQTLAIVIHENALLVTYPLFLFAYYFVSKDEERRVTHWLFAFVPALVFVFIFLWQDMFLPGTVLEQQVAFLAQFPFLVDGVTTSLPRFQATSFRKYLEFKSQFGFGLDTYTIFSLAAPFLVVVLAHIWVTIKRLSKLEMTLLTGAVLVPQTLHFIAWDVARIATFSHWCAIAGLWFLCHGRKLLSTSVPIVSACVLVLIAHLIVDVPLFGDTEHHNISLRFMLYAPAIVALIALIWSERSSLKHVPGREKSAAPG